MRNKIILLTLLVFSVSSQASWFVGVNGGGNITRDTGVGDLPMAREEFQINAGRMSDLSAINAIYMNVINNGGTHSDALAALKDYMVLQLKYKIGWNVAFDLGYELKHFKVLFKNKFIKMDYDTINDDDQGVPVLGWGQTSGYTFIFTELFMGEYKLPLFKNSGFVPVVGCGLGWSFVKDAMKKGTKKVSRNQTVFAYEFKAGLNYSFNKNFQGTLETVFFGTSEVKATNNKIKQFQLNLGARYRFN